jgi:hypothetical protein
MPIPEPLTIVAITGGILANLATDILRGGFRSLHVSLVGRIVRALGLTEAGLEVRMANIVARGLALYFETHPEFQLSGVVAFFRDPDTAQQLSSYILDRREIDARAIQRSLDRHLRPDFLTRSLIVNRGLDPSTIVSDFLRCYRRALVENSSSAEMAILLEVIDQSRTLAAELRGSDTRLIQETQRISDELMADRKVLEQLAEDQRAIKRRLGLDRPRADVSEELRQSLNLARRRGMFEDAGLCDGFHAEPRPDSYFVAQEFTPDREDLRGALADALREFGVEPVCADDTLWMGHILCKISALIQGTPFGVYQLTMSQNRNVYLELGIAMGLRRPFILVKEREASVPPIASGLEYYPIESYVGLKYGLQDRARPFLANLGSGHPRPLPAPGSEATGLIAHGGIEEVDFCVAASRAVAAHGLTPVILNDPTGTIGRYLQMEALDHHILAGDGRLEFDEALDAIQSARFGVYRVDRAAGPEVFLALGISLGLSRPGVLALGNFAEAPSDLAGLTALRFKSYSSLAEPLYTRIGRLLSRPEREQ